jgi:hypothetical protein
MSVGILPGNSCHIWYPLPARGGPLLPNVEPMAEGSSTTLTEATEPAGDLVAVLKSFAAGHGGATAVIEYVGRRGARIVLVGEDGIWADQVAQSTDVARQACEAAGVPIQNQWERELLELMRPSNDLWRSMGRRSLTR